MTVINERAPDADAELARYRSQRFQTRAVHVGVDKDSAFNSATTPIYPTSTFYWDSLDKNKGYDYTRSGNPTRRALEENLASLEGGVDCRATATGMAACTAALHLFKSGDHVIAGHDIYGGTFRLMHDVMPNMGIEVSFVNMGEPGNVAEAIRPNTRGVWIETPSNPLLNLVDIAAVVKIAKERGLVTIADNTFLSPFLQRPIEMGVDVVLHSTTKYLNGHSDVVGGAVISANREHAERIGFIVNALGLACSPFDAWLVLRGVKTLGPRMKAHEANAEAIAAFLDKHPAVEKVYYPGLRSHPQHALAKKQQSGFGAMLSFDLKAGRPAAEKAFSRSKLFLLAESLGGVESLWEYPETMSHASMTPQARLGAGISEKTIRVSVGIEDKEDLLSDLEQALGE